MYCLGQKHGENMSFDNKYALFWSYKNKTVYLHFVCSPWHFCTFAPLLHKRLCGCIKLVLSLHNNDFAPIKCNWNAALCSLLLLSDYCNDLFNPLDHNVVFQQLFAGTKWSEFKFYVGTFWVPELPGLLRKSAVPLIRLSTFGHHTQLNQTKWESRVGVEQSGFSVKGMERMMLVCPPLPTAVFPVTLVDSFTHWVSATETTHQHQVCFPSLSLMKNGFVFTLELAMGQELELE